MRKKQIVRRMGIAAALIFFLALGSYVFLKTPQFHQYALAKIIEEVQRSTGGTLEVENWDFQIAPAVVNLYGITLHGTEHREHKPLLKIEKLTVGLSRHGLLHRKLQLTELLVQRPVVSLWLDRDGKTNIPMPPKKGNSTTRITVWDLAVAHVLFSDGEVYCNNKENKFDVELHDLGTAVSFDPTATSYTGSVSYHDGRLKYAKYSPLTHNLDAQFSATPDGASFRPVVSTIGSSRISLQGEIRNYIHPTVNAAYDIFLHTQDFSSTSPGASPKGDVHLAGKIRYESLNHQPLLRAIVLDGTLDSGALQVASSVGHIEFQRLKAEYHLAEGNLIAPAIVADLLNGRLTADAKIEHLDATSPVPEVHASFEQISLEAVRQSIKRPEARRIPLTGTVNGRVDASWTAGSHTIRLASELALHGSLSDESTQPVSPIPVDGVAQINYDSFRKILELRQARFQSASTSVIADGQLSRYSNLKVQAVAGDLHPFTQLAAFWRRALGGSAPPLPTISGSARLDAVVQGSIDQPTIRGNLNTQNLQIHGSQWSSAQLAFEASASHFGIENGSMTNTRQGVLHFRAQVGLKNWTFTPTSPISANVTASAISLADLEHLANQQYPISGTLSADVTLYGSALNPSGHGSLDVVKATAYNEPVQHLGIQFQAGQNGIDANFKLTLPAGTVISNLNYVPATKAYQLQFKVPGIVLEKLQTVRMRSMPLRGTLIASAHGEGTLDDPQLSATLEISRLETRQSAILGIKGQVNVAHQRADVALDFDVAQAHIQTKGTVDLREGYYTEASLETGKVSLQPILAEYASSIPSGFEGVTEFHASFRGPLDDRSRMEVHVTIPVLSASYGGMQVENVGPLCADYRDSVAVLQPGEIRGTAASLRFQGRVPLGGPAAMSINAQGSVNLGLLSMLAAGMTAKGTLGFDVHSSGSIQNPDVEGQIKIKEVALSSSAVPVGLHNLNGVVDVSKGKVQIRNLSGQLGDGQISVGGSIAYRPSLQFNLILQDKSVRLLYPEEMRTVLDSNLTFTGTGESSTLAGRVVLTSLGFTPDFDLSDFVSQFSGTSHPPSGEGFGDRVKLRVGVQSKQNLSASSSRLSVEGGVNLQLIGTLANPVIIGRADLTSGELFYRNSRYSLERGIVSFDNPSRTRPVLNMEVATRIEQYNLTITLIGPIDKFTTSYTSDPPLPSADIISLLIRGQTVTEAAASGIGTNAILAGPVAGQLQSGVQRLAGFSSFQISPVLGANPSALIALQQRVTKNFLFTFSTDVSQPGSQQFQGEYLFNPRWSVRVTGNEVGGVAVDGRYHTKF